MLSGSVGPGLLRLFGLGTLTGAMLSAGVLATMSLAFGELPASLRVLVLGVLVVTVIAVDLVIPDRLPHRDRMVRRSIVLEDSRLGVLQFGFEMGTGVQTLAPRGAAHVYVVASLLLDSPSGTLLGGVGFATGRVLMSVGSVTHGLEAFDRLINRFDRLVGSIALAAAVLATLSIARR